jgi:hypothetical protein
MAEQSLLDVLGLERLAEERVGLKIDHAGSEVVACPPVRVDLVDIFGREYALENVTHLCLSPSRP